MDQIVILIAGDESVAARPLAAMIMRLGHRVIGMAASGDEALRQVIENTPNVVVMDIEAIVAPEAIEAVTCIRLIFNTPVVFVIGAGDEMTRALAAVAEPSGFLTRPFSDTELEHALEEAVVSDLIYAGKAKGPKPSRRLIHRHPVRSEHGFCEPVAQLHRSLPVETFSGRRRMHGGKDPGTIHYTII